MSPNRVPRETSLEFCDISSHNVGPGLSSKISAYARSWPGSNFEKCVHIKWKRDWIMMSSTLTWHELWLNSGWYLSSTLFGKYSEFELSMASYSTGLNWSKRFRSYRGNKNWILETKKAFGNIICMLEYVLYWKHRLIYWKNAIRNIKMIMRSMNIGVGPQPLGRILVKRATRVRVHFG